MEDYGVREGNRTANGEETRGNKGEEKRKGIGKNTRMTIGTEIGENIRR